MDCRQAQAQLDLVTLGQDSMSGPDALAVRQHLAGCDACRLAFQAQQVFDREIARAMSDVPVPNGLVERLTAAVRSETAAAGASGVFSGVGSGLALRPTRSSLWLSVGLVATLLVCGAIWVVQPRSTLNESSVATFARIDLNGLQVDDQPVSLPKGWDSLRSIQFGETARRTQEKGIDVVMQAFLLRIDRKAPVSGVLARVHYSRWQPAPDAGSFPNATIQYAAFGAWVVWREGETVFVCILQDPHAMQRLKELIDGSRRLT